MRDCKIAESGAVGGGVCPGRECAQIIHSTCDGGRSARPSPTHLSAALPHWIRLATRTGLHVLSSHAELGPKRAECAATGCGPVIFHFLRNLRAPSPMANST